MGANSTTSQGDDIVLICYRGACTAAAHPCGYNRVTHGLYCLSCAKTINAHSVTSSAPGGPFFPLLGAAADLPDGGAYLVGIVLVRPPNSAAKRQPSKEEEEATEGMYGHRPGHRVDEAGECCHWCPVCRLEEQDRQKAVQQLRQGT